MPRHEFHIFEKVEQYMATGLAHHKLALSVGARPYAPSAAVPKLVVGLSFTDAQLEQYTRSAIALHEHRRSKTEEKLAPSADVVLESLRCAGLTVAAHNDYRLGGKAHTFWLMVDKTGMSYKGEGQSDRIALRAVERMFNYHQDLRKTKAQPK